MKKWIVIAACVLTVVSAAAQETLVGEGFHSGGYGGPVWKIGLVNGKAGLFSGGRGGWIINHTFAIGGGGYGMVTDVETEATSGGGKALYLAMDYGGFEMEYIHDSDKLIHWTFHTLIGGGSVKLKEHDPREEIASDHVFLFEPQHRFQHLPMVPSRSRGELPRRVRRRNGGSLLLGCVRAGVFDRLQIRQFLRHDSSDGS